MSFFQHRQQIERWNGNFSDFGVISSNVTHDVHREEARVYTAAPNGGILLKLRLPYDVRNYTIGPEWIIVRNTGAGDVRVVTFTDVTVDTLVGGGGHLKARIGLTDPSTADGVWYSMQGVSGFVALP